MRILPLLTILALGCHPFDHMPDNNLYTDGDELWSADLAAATDGLYVRLPYAGELVRLSDDGSWKVVDLDGAEPVDLITTPDGSKVMTFARWPTCKDDDPKIKTVDDCPSDELEWSTELDLVSEGARSATTNIPPHLNQLAFNEGGTIAVAYLDYENGDNIDISGGVVDLTEVVFINLTDGTTRSVSIGFSPSNILFSQDGSLAVVMSRSKVVAVDLGTFDKVVEFPLTLDADTEIDPSGAVLTPDGRFVLVAVQGQSDLYKLDLVNYSIDIVSLDAAPSDLGVSISSDRTVVTYAGKAQVDLLEHELFTNETVVLDEPMTDILVQEGFVVLYNSSNKEYHDAYKLDTDTTELTEYVLGNPVSSMEITESGAYAVGILRPESGGGSGLDSYQDSRYGLGVLDLSGNDSVSLVLESEPVGLALVEDEANSYALLLLAGDDRLLQVNLATPSSPSIIELPAPPTGIGAMPDGRFYITHAADLGLVSILDPTTGVPESISGFATVGLLEEDLLPRRDGGGE